MIKHNLKLLVISLLVLAGCNKNNREAEPSVKTIGTADTITMPDSLSLNKVIPFDVSEDEMTYTASDFKLVFDSVENFCDLSIKNDFVSKINFDGRPFDGVGYAVFLYRSEASERKVLVFEAIADIGTAWYYLVVMDGNRMSKTFFVDEPRANSEEVSLQKFLFIHLREQECLLKFDKKYVAKYSIIPKGLKVDNHFIYLTK